MLLAASFEVKTMKSTLIILTLTLCLPLLGQQNLKQAEHLYQQRNWPAAAVAYQKVVKENPFHGPYWYRLGYIAIQTKDYDLAIQANEKATDLLAFPGNAMYNLACTYALAGNGDIALNWLERAIKKGYNNLHQIMQDEDLKSLKNHPRFLALMGQHKQAFTSREAGWRADLNYLAHIMEDRHYQLYHNISLEDWQHRIRYIDQNIRAWSDSQIAWELTRLVAAIGDGHTNLFPYLNDKMHRLPIYPYLFEEGLFIIAAKPGYEHLLGKQILKVGKKEIDSLIAESFNFIGNDNVMQNKMMAPLVLQTAEFYSQAGAIPEDASSVPFLIEMEANKKQSFDLVAEPIVHRNHPFFGTPPDWPKAHQLRGKDGPLYLQNPSDNYWYTYLEKEKVVYFQYNQVEDKPEEDIQHFSRRLFHFIEQNEVDALVIDIRLNQGGNGFLNRPIIEQIIKSEKINQKGHLFTIIGRATFSAAMDFAAKLEQQTQTVFVGEPTGSRPNNYGEHNGFKLPYSGLFGSYSSRYFQLGYTSDDQRPWIAPHLVALPKIEAYLENRDLAMEAILNYLDKD